MSKRYWSGTHRLVSPAETLARVRPFFPVMGITRVADITGLDVIGLPVVAVHRPNSRSVAVSLGKALDLTAAKASGVMESIEAFMAERIVRPLVLGSVNDLRFSHPLVDVDGLPRTATSQYHPDAPMLWIEGQELLSQTPMWVPYEMVHTAYTTPSPTGTGCFVATSNGLASGNHLLEAIGHGICEVIERDAFTLHKLRSGQDAASRRIDVSTVGDTDCAEALGRLSRAGMLVGIWDMTSDIGIPAFLCRIGEYGSRPVRTSRVFDGMGCHPSPGIALLRAVTEAAQSRGASIAGVRDDTAAFGRKPGRRPDPGGNRETELADAGTRHFTSVKVIDSDSIDEDVAAELDALRSAGITQVVAVDLTREEFGIPVVRIIVPGLEGPTEVVACRLGRRAMDLVGSR